MSLYSFVHLLFTYNLGTVKYDNIIESPSEDPGSTIKFRKCGKLDAIKEIAPHIISPLSKRQHYVNFI